VRNNEPIYDLVDFTQTFLSKHTLLNVLTKYCVFTSENLLLVMRPYQIAATEAILRKIKTSSNYKEWGKREGGGYIWHTTGSGKTLTSFKTARLASQMPEIDKVLFVVDRKDLDYQTMKEYDRFEKGAANSNTSTAVLTRQLGDPNARIIITTIQKLTNFIGHNARHEVYAKHVVLIFDECHRSQFGDMHKAITKKFKKYHMFGFTGTPIFPENAGAVRNPEFTTTEGAFGTQLHCYTIVDAIRDGNVLPFKVDYISTMHEQEQITDEKVPNIDREKALAAPQRIAQVSKYILEHFAQKTKRNARSYSYSKLSNIEEVATAKGRDAAAEVKVKTRMVGFNSILAVQSIPFAKLYYMELKRQMEQLPPDQRLKIATIYSYAANEDVEADSGLPDDEDNESTDGLDQSSRDFLEAAIEDYNAQFGTSYDTSAEKFQNYYKDLSLRMKNREVDLLIVVNMFLTGFDATTLNTLWVDKNLKMHGLLQAYSRTNRILNSIKTFGNIVCFRNLEPATNACLQLFGNKDAGGLILLKPFEAYYEGYTDDDGKETPGYRALIMELLTQFPLGQVIVGETAEKAFIRLFGTILRALNILTTFDQFEGRELITEEQLLDYKSLYLNLHDKYRDHDKTESVVINDDIVFEMELVKSVEINIDYILFLVGQLTGDEDKDREIVLKVRKSVDSSPDLRNKADLIDSFIEQYSPSEDANDEWHRFVRENQHTAIDQIIEAEHLKPELTRQFMAQAFRDAGVKESGTAIAAILPPMSPFAKGGARSAMKNRVIALLKGFFDRFYDISGGVFYDDTKAE
jgi:type I restriction enzyme R subunit